MKLKVGQFARTKLGTIGKIENNFFYIKLRLKKGNYITIEKDDIAKVGYNIIDILEKGDYVNGYIVEEIKRGYDGKIWIDNGTRGHDEGGEYTIWKRNEDIKTVITHEQMKQMVYKVGD